MFRVQIKTTNDAFEDDFYNGNAEVARILREIADSVERGDAGSFGDASLTLRDINGNTVGTAGFGR